MPALWLPGQINSGSRISILCGFLMWYSECGQQQTMQLQSKVMVYVHTYVHTERQAEKLPEVLKAEQWG